MYKKFINTLYLSSRFYLIGGSCIILFVLAYFVPLFFEIAQIVFAIFAILFLADYVILFIFSRRFPVRRNLPEKMSNGDANKIQLTVSNPYNFKISIKIIDEVPVQLQERNFILKLNLPPKSKKTVFYLLRPQERGVYNFGNIIVLVRSSLGLAIRLFTVEQRKNVAVYPSFLHLRNMQLLAHNVITDGGGHRRVRRIGQSMEFEQIKDYVAGDDIRTINWRATARRGGLMSNHYVDEKSQQVYCILDKGRLMKMPFKGLSLLDYSINSILALQNTCLQKQDKAGLLSFSNHIDTLITADRRPKQAQLIINALFNEKTEYKESDYEMLYLQVRHHIKNRSLLMLYTNFETLQALNRQLSYLKSLAKFHLLVVVFFENTELTALEGVAVNNVNDVYLKTIAGKYSYEKKLIVKELRSHGILSILSTPEKLTVNSINKYLEIKSKRLF